MVEKNDLGKLTSLEDRIWVIEGMINKSYQNVLSHGAKEV